MKQKLLSICFPTYNRASCIGEQLKRLSTVDKSVLRDVEIIVSDNCSPDNTKEVILSYAEKLDFQYNRNEKNLGPDENYLFCFHNATGKYVWLVGDDDYLVTENLHIVINTLSKIDVGFLFIKPEANSPQPIYKEFKSKESYLKNMGFWITFLTSSVVRNEYVRDVDVKPYKGTWQEYVPFFLTAITKGKTNGELLYNIYEAPAAGDTNGGYKIFNVFGVGFLKIVKDFYDQGVLSKKAYRIEKEASFSFLIPFAYRLLIERRSSNFIVEDAWSTLYGLFGKWKVKMALLRFFIKRTMRYLYAIIYEK